jgi:hypothetical protein
MVVNLYLAGMGLLIIYRGFMGTAPRVISAPWRSALPFSAACLHEAFTRDFDLSIVDLARS